MYCPSTFVVDDYVAGMRFWGGAKVLDKLAAGKKLTLVREEDNPFDPAAVALYYKDTKIGYLPRKDNSLVAQFMSVGYTGIFECRILKVDPTADPWKQVRVGVYLVDETSRKSKSKHKHGRK